MKKLIIAILLAGLPAMADLVQPKEYKDFDKVTVMITDKEGRSGGTGWVLKSTPTKSYVITNRHVCGIYDMFGSLTVKHSKGSFQAQRVKISETHDLCLVEVYTDLGVDTKIAETAAAYGDKITIAGHPRLLPLMLSEGHVGEKFEITIVVGVRKCTNEEKDSNNLYCLNYGVVPIAKNFESTTASAFIAGGNSGSGVFNSQGEVVGVAFAGFGGGYSQAFIVPFEFLKTFVKTEVKDLKWNNVSGPRDLVISVRSSGERGETNKNTIYPAIENSIITDLTEKVVKKEK